MNLFLVSLLFCAGFLSIVNADPGNPKPQNDHVKMLYQKCQQESNAEEKDLDNFKKMEMPTSEKGKCMMACLMREAKIIVDKKFSKEGAMALASRYYQNQEQNMEKAKQIITTCDKQVEKERNECTIAGKLADCVVTEAQKVGLSSVPRG